MNFFRSLKFAIPAGLILWGLLALAVFARSCLRLDHAAGL